MPWFWSNNSDKDANSTSESSTPKQRIEKQLQALPIYAPEIVVPTVVLTATLLALHTFYRHRLRRISTVPQLPPSFLPSHRSLFGTAVSVGDADNFRLFHTPGGRLLGWGWFRPIPSTRKDLTKAGTIHIRLAGIDAPECAHFGNPAQPYSSEAQTWLTNYVLGKRLRVTLLARDRYERVVCSVKIWKWGIQKNVSLEMVKAGWAEVYVNHGAEYGGIEMELKKALDVAKYFFFCAFDDVFDADFVDGRKGGCGNRI
jgi:endonuclease YncB( thermonuclease family)